MGAWGHGYFEDDSALDFMAAIEASSNPKKAINDALDLASEADYLDVDEGNAVIVAAAYIDRYINGTKFSVVDESDALDVDTFPDRNPKVDLSDLRSKAIIALTKILTDDSELKQLWEENDEEYPAWRSGVEQLIKRLR